MPKRSPCPVACALDLLGDRWTLLIVRDLFQGKHHYDEFLSSPEGIATNILAARLKQLVQTGLVIRKPNPLDGRRSVYQLTPAGKSLRPLLQAVADWGHAHLPGTLRPSID